MASNSSPARSSLDAASNKVVIVTSPVNECDYDLATECDYDPTTESVVSKGSRCNVLDEEFGTMTTYVMPKEIKHCVDIYIAQVPKGFGYGRPFFTLEAMQLARMVPFEIIDIIFDWNGHCPGGAYDLDRLGSSSCSWCGVDTACWGLWWWDTHNTYNGPKTGQPGSFYSIVTCSSSCCWYYSNRIGMFQKECECACDCYCNCAYTSKN